MMTFPLPFPDMSHLFFSRKNCGDQRVVSELTYQCYDFDVDVAVVVGQWTERQQQQMRNEVVMKDAFGH